MTGGLRAHGVTASYDGVAVLQGVDLTVTRGETVGLRGPSGSGKSTLVGILAMLRAPDAGFVSVDGRRVDGVLHRVPPPLRTRVAVLFQSPRAATDPRLDLAAIIAEPMRAAARTDGLAEEVADLAQRVGLTVDLLGRKPHAVSDGQLQRACLARALAQRPDYVLCDEATTMLDASTQAHVAAVLDAYQRERDAGLLVVSHDEDLLWRWAGRVETLGAAVGAGSAGEVLAD